MHGPLDESLKALASRLGVSGRIIWLGERDARGVLAGFDIFALSSQKEGLPYVVLEAMAAGLPVVATASAGVECLVLSGVNGYVVPMNDVTAFASALSTLANDETKAERCGKASLARASQFTVDAMVEQTLAAYVSRQ
jgi:glycosyltransferase involved in cell wall biosynthesis